MKAAAPLELMPIVARPSGFFVSLIFACFFSERQHFVLDELRIKPVDRVILEPALAPLRVLSAGADH